MSRTVKRETHDRMKAQANYAVDAARREQAIALAEAQLWKNRCEGQELEYKEQADRVEAAHKKQIQDIEAHCHKISNRSEELVAAMTLVTKEIAAITFRDARRVELAALLASAQATLKATLATHDPKIATQSSIVRDMPCRSMESNQRDLEREAEKQRRIGHHGRKPAWMGVDMAPDRRENYQCRSGITGGKMPL